MTNEKRLSTNQNFFYDCQMDFGVDLIKPSSKFWFSSRNLTKDEKTKHDYVHVVSASELSMDDPNLIPTKINNLSFSIKNRLNDKSTTFKSTNKFLKTEKSEISSLHTSPLNDIFVTSSNNSVNLYSTKDLKCLKELKDLHKLDINNAKFFPSGKVLLTASSDFTLKVTDLEGKVNPIDYFSHKRAVTDTDVVERGTNFISSSYDGTVKLWETATATVMNSVSLSAGKINAISLEGDFGSKSGNLVFAAADEGAFVLDFRSKNLTAPISFQSNNNSLSLVRSLDVNANNLIAFGCSFGNIVLYDKRNPKEELILVKKSKARINKIKFLKNLESSLMFSNGEGSLSLVKFSQNLDDFNFEKEFIGNDLNSTTFDFFEEEKSTIFAGNEIGELTVFEDFC
ncbi:hypothetical protein HK099_005715 [Clydaea vesicula]|uniref:Uncharacterized protein n=1 Tax=Clydaea vesicula TaxID=447962 RepID=A0AAD5U698_9FUNG|nr:hypothetical protein HK099_005715 [Clydaea vesicula]